MTVAREASLLRRYVIARCSGRHPCLEYVRYVAIGKIGAWQRCDERTARESERWYRLRIPGRPWCPVLGTHVTIAQDDALQAYFQGQKDHDWVRLEQAVRRCPTRSLREWRASGRRLIAAARAAAAGHRLPGRLAGWPATRGRGTRSLLDAA